jgi:hypothetical protein
MPTYDERMKLEFFDIWDIVDYIDRPNAAWLNYNATCFIVPVRDINEKNKV